MQPQNQDYNKVVICYDSDGQEDMPSTEEGEGQGLGLLGPPQRFFQNNCLVFGRPPSVAMRPSTDEVTLHFESRPG